MPEPKLEILGIYRPTISAETWQAQWESSEDDEFTHEHFAGLVLIEAVATNLPGSLELDKFGQMNLTFPDDKSRMLVAYDEGLLSSDGETLIDRGIGCVQGTGPLRFAAYLHYYDPNRPIEWQFGEVAGPPIEPAPIRLMMLMPYCPI